METYFRNHLSGALTPLNLQTQQTVPLILQSFSRYTNFVGNVLGTAGYHNSYQANFGGSASNCNTSIYNLGWGGRFSAQSALFNNDSRVVSTLMRWGNYDVVNGKRAVEPGRGAERSEHLWPTPCLRLARSPLHFISLADLPFGLAASRFPGVGPEWWAGTFPIPADTPIRSLLRDCYRNVMAGSSQARLACSRSREELLRTICLYPSPLPRRTSTVFERQLTPESARPGLRIGRIGPEKRKCNGLSQAPGLERCSSSLLVPVDLGPSIGTGTFLRP